MWNVLQNDDESFGWAIFSWHCNSIADTVIQKDVFTHRLVDLLQSLGESVFQLLSGKLEIGILLEVLNIGDLGNTAVRGSILAGYKGEYRRHGKYKGQNS